MVYKPVLNDEQMETLIELVAEARKESDDDDEFTRLLYLGDYLRNVRRTTREDSPG